MNRSFLLGAASGLLAGLLVAVVSFQVGRAGRLTREPEPVVAAPSSGPRGTATAPAAGPTEASGAVPLDASERIATARSVVERDPKNLEAWVDLGNLYFDTRQPQKSIEAYARALELKPDNPDVLTDQGVMFRAVGAYDKAIANFEKANRISPGHLQSLYNLGVVYAFDLRDVPKAEEAWNRLIQIAPASENANQARQALAQLRKN